MTLHRGHGKSRRKKIASKEIHDFGNVHARLVTLMMIPLRARDNTHARPARTGKVLTRGNQGVVALPPGPTILDRDTMLMEDPGKAHIHPATLTNTLLSLSGNGPVRLATFVNALIPTTKLTKDITGSTIYPGIPNRMPRHVFASACDSRTIPAMKPIILRRRIPCSAIGLSFSQR